MKNKSARPVIGLITILLLLAAGLSQAATNRIAVTAAPDTLRTSFGPPLDSEWQPYSIPLTAGTFKVSDSLFDRVLSNVQTFRIRTEMSDAKDIAGIDSIRVGSRYSASFSSGTEEWSASGDGTLEWKSYGGRPGGYLQVSDWGTGDWHWAVAPPAWSGDWSELKGSAVTFYFKTDHPDYPALIEITSGENTQLVLSAAPLIVPLGSYTLAKISLATVASADVKITLTSSDPGCLHVPEVVTISRGTREQEFKISAAAREPGCTSVITAEAPGFQTGRLTLAVGKPVEASTYATLRGRVTDAITKEGIAGAAVWLAGRNTVTDAHGDYTITDIPTSVIAANFSAEPLAGKAPLQVQFTDLSSVGSYTLFVSATDYMGTESILAFSESEDKYLEISLSPVIKPGEMRLILNWGNQPKDLDLHLRTPVIEGVSHEIYWDNKGNLESAPYVLLDVDHQEGYGPETITIGALQPGTYRCFVENFSELPALSGANARVQIYTSAGLLQTITIPTSGTGTFWYVCEIDGATGAVTVRNLIQPAVPAAALAARRAKVPADHEILGSGGVISWNWDFDGDLFIDSNLQNPVHTYGKPGLYSVTLRVSDGSRDYSVRKDNYISVQPGVITDVSWSRQYAPLTQDLYTVHALDTLTAWAGGAGGTLLFTKNGGATWSVRNVDAKYTLKDLFFTTALNGWAVGYDSKQNAAILRSTDGGLTWSRVLSSTTARLFSLHMVNGTLGWASGYEGKIETTTDGGATWSQQFTGLAAGLYAVYFLNAEKGIVAGDNGVILRTGDGGANWQLMTSGINVRINDIWFADENLGWAVCENGKILHTTNGGSTWSALQVSSAALRAIHFTSSWHGYAAGDGGLIFKTYDGGESWSEESSTVGSTLNDLFIVHPACGWAVGAGGVILRLHQGASYPFSITNLTARATGPNTVGLTWENPSDEYAGTVIVRSATGYPASVSDGVTIYNGTRSFCRDSLLTANTTYYYAAFAYNSAGRYSPLGATSRALVRTDEGFELHGYKVTVSSVDASVFPVVKSFVSVVDSATMEPITGLTKENFGVREDGTKESPITVESVSGTSGAKADIVFVFDTTGSMGEEINGLKERASAFADALAAKGIDYRLALVTYGDAVDKINDFTAEISTFKGWINSLYASGGGDTKENSLEGLASATTLSFRAVSQRIFILITDADYHQAGESGGGTTTYTTTSMIALLQSQRIMCNVVGPDYPQFRQMAAETGGLYFDINGDFQAIIDKLSVALSSQYVVSYTTHNPIRDNTWRDVIITAARGIRGGWDSGRYYIAGKLPNVRDFTAVAVAYNKIYCRWSFPPGKAHEGVKVLRRMGGCPADPADGEIVYTGVDSTCIDAGLTPETTYYYSAFTYNSSGQVAEASTSARGYAHTWPFYSGTSGWVVASSGTTSNLYAIIADSLHALAAGDNGVIVRTANGGASWNSAAITAKSVIRDLAFVGPATGWLVGQSSAGAGLCMKTNSGGDSWISSPTSAAGVLYANEMVSSALGWNAGSQGLIEKTVNGGSTWTSQYSAAGQTFYDITFVNPDTGWAVGEAGAILRTVNGGAVWSSQNSGVTSAIRGVVFIDANQGWAVTGDGKVLRTRNGGVTWSSTSVSSLPLHAVDFADAGNGVAVGQGGRIYRTHDGGGTWILEASGVSVGLNAVCLLNAYSGWIAGDGGTILMFGRKGAGAYSGLDVTVSSVDAEAFPVIKSFVSVVDSASHTAVTDLTAENFKVREEGLLQSPIKVEMVSTGSGARADIAFVFDVTGSMGDEIAGLKSRALSFADALAAKGIDFRLGLVTFSDSTEEVHDFTADAAEFKAWIDGLRASGGGDTKENALEALARASKLSYRATSQKMAVLITDADYHQAGESGGGTTTYTTETMISLLQSQRIVTHVVGPNGAPFHSLAERTSGLWYSISADFAGIIDAIGALLTSQYVITYTTSNPVPDNTWRQVAVVAERSSKGGYDIGRYYVGASRIALAPAALIGIKDASFDISVTVDGLVNLGLVHFVLAYNATKIDVVSWAAGDFLKQGGAADPTLIVTDDGVGLVDVSMTRVGAATGASGSGTLLSVRFKVLTADCASDLNLNSVQLRQPDNTDLPVASSGAHIQAATAVGLIGDFDGDLDIDLRDFTLLAGYWQPANSAAGDIGPASGSVPALTVMHDGVVNFEDLFVFTRMWNWYQSRPVAVAALSRSTATPLAWKVSPLPGADGQYLCELIASEISGLAMAHLRLRYNPEQLRVGAITAGALWEAGGATTALMVDHESRCGIIDLALARLAEKNRAAEVSGAGALVRIVVEERGAAGALCDWKVENLDLRSPGSWILAQAPETGQLRISELPTRYALAQNYPNPFNGRTEVRFSLPKSGTARVVVLNILGQPVRTLAEGRFEAGSYRRIWDGRNESGQEVVSGIYLLRMEAAGYTELRRMAFVK
ncbi:MAG TPA: YCF48-related protein [bacterium]|nr:YCF48-related protein [bacterium]HQI48361.1 YCF48-related protein [bacterium]HQJ63128.1 YCF48-related protein [bacterium]